VSLSHSQFASAKGSLLRRWKPPHPHAGNYFNDLLKADREGYLAPIESVLPAVEVLGVTDCFLISSPVTRRSCGAGENSSGAGREDPRIGESCGSVTCAVLTDLRRFCGDLQHLRATATPSSRSSRRRHEPDEIRNECQRLPHDPRDGPLPKTGEQEEVPVRQIGSVRAPDFRVPVWADALLNLLRHSAAHHRVRDPGFP